MRAEQYTTAVAYLRVSGNAQVTGDGFTRQREACLQRAAAAGLHLVHFYEERGVTGTKGVEHRPALADLLLDAPERGATVVLVERIDRLARDMIVAELLLNQFREHNLTVIEAEEGRDLTKDASPEAKFIRRVLAAVAELDRDLITVKLRLARERKKAKTGRCEGQKPFGYYKGEPEAIKRARELFGAGYSRKRRRTYREIARLLNEEGHATRTGVPWTGRTVVRMLRRSYSKNRWLELKKRPYR